MPDKVSKVSHPMHYRKDGNNHQWSTLPYMEDGSVQAIADCCWVNGELSDYETAKRLAKLWLVENLF
jgi:hypothetical protein